MEIFLEILGTVIALLTAWAVIRQLRVGIAESEAFDIGNDCYIVRMKLRGSKLIDNHFSSVDAEGFLLMPLESYKSGMEVGSALESSLPLDLFIASSTERSLAFVIKRISLNVSNRPLITLNSSNRILSIKARTPIANTPDPANQMIELMNDFTNFQRELDKRSPYDY